MGVAQSTRNKAVMALRSELLLLLFISLLAAVLAWFGAPLLIRLPFGLLAVLLLPGYSMSLALLPRAQDLEGAERLALSFGLSLSVVIVLALVLNYTPLGLGARSIILSETGWTVLALAAAWWRRRGIAPSELLSVVVRDWHWQSTSKATKLALMALAGAGLLTAVALTFTLTASPRFTEFFVLGPEGLAENYPRVAAQGEPVTVTVGIANREERSANYSVTVTSNGDTLATAGPFETAPGQQWETPVTFTLREVGNSREIEFLLFKDGAIQPYRHLVLWLDVIPGPTQR